jgi:PKD repeat protein
MKKLKFFYCFIAVSLIVSCGSDDTGTIATPDPGDITVDFSFTSNDNLFVFTNLTEGATTYKWDFGDLSFYCDKENPSYRYTKAGGDLQVTLTAMDDVGHEAHTTKTISAPEVLNIDIKIDGILDDWKEVEVLVDDSEIGSSMQKLKAWSDDENLYLHIEGNTTMLMEIMDMYIDTDGNSNTGFSAWQWEESSGAELLIEGPIASLEWGDIYKSPHTSLSNAWVWNYVSGLIGFTSSGIVNVDANSNAIEFSIPLSTFGDIGKSISFSIAEVNSGWAAVGQIPEAGFDKTFVTYNFPIASSGFCE